MKFYLKINFNLILTMFEKSILVCYINIDGCNTNQASNTLLTFTNHLHELFPDEKDLKILVVPVRGQQSKVELLNASYPKWEEVLEQIQQSNLDLLQNE